MKLGCASSRVKFIVKRVDLNRIDVVGSEPSHPACDQRGIVTIRAVTQAIVSGGQRALWGKKGRACSSSLISAVRN